MERVYEYNKISYRYKVLMVNILMFPLLGYFLYRIFFTGTNIYLWAFGAIVCVYSLSSSFIRKTNPRIIKISDEEIEFISFGKKSFEINQLTKFRVRVSTPNYQVLIRLEDVNRQQGSFWVTYSQFNDKLDLIAEFDYLEKKIHPDSLRFKGRKGMGDKRPELNTTIPQEPQAEDVS
ncbi:MAG: hypothetical protein FWG07_10100 [Treponema sp.]|nr:hypothetical protein [Treponema sp.]